MTREGATIQALQGNIEALNETIANQESAFNNMREEIEDHCALAKENHCKYCYRCTNMMGIREILETIDKYRL